MGKNVKCLTKAGYHFPGFSLEAIDSFYFRHHTFVLDRTGWGFKLTILIFLIIRMA